MKKDYVLNDRQKDVLRIIIDSHVESALPIGSTLVSNVLDLSSATIRNVMCELEDMGYIDKPHTSAGRVPTRNGYRYYVNNMLELGAVPNQQKRFIEKEYYTVKTDSIEAILEGISHLLSVMTRYTGIACLSNLKFYIEGASHMMDMPEFQSPKSVRALLRLFDEKSELLKLLNEDLGTEGVKIHIGEEEDFDMLGNMSLITGNYRIRGTEKGSLGVLGPMRMNYSALIPLVDFVSRAIEAVLEEINE